MAELWQNSPQAGSSHIHSPFISLVIYWYMWCCQVYVLTVGTPPLLIVLVRDFRPWFWQIILEKNRDLLLPLWILLQWKLGSATALWQAGRCSGWLMHSNHLERLFLKLLFNICRSTLYDLPHLLKKVKKLSWGRMPIRWNCENVDKIPEEWDGNCIPQIITLATLIKSYRFSEQTPYVCNKSYNDVSLTRATVKPIHIQTGKSRQYQCVTCLGNQESFTQWTEG